MIISHSPEGLVQINQVLSRPELVIMFYCVFLEDKRSIYTKLLS